MMFGDTRVTIKLPLIKVPMKNKYLFIYPKYTHIQCGDKQET